MQSYQFCFQPQPLSYIFTSLEDLNMNAPQIHKLKAVKVQVSFPTNLLFSLASPAAFHGSVILPHTLRSDLVSILRLHTGFIQTVSHTELVSLTLCTQGPQAFASTFFSPCTLSCVTSSSYIPQFITMPTSLPHAILTCQPETERHGLNYCCLPSEAVSSLPHRRTERCTRVLLF